MRMAIPTSGARRKKLSALLRRRWLALSKRQTDEMVERVKAIPSGEFDAAQKKTETSKGNAPQP